jgi:hypothetical protein
MFNFLFVYPLEVIPEHTHILLDIFRDGGNAVMIVEDLDDIL